MLGSRFKETVAGALLGGTLAFAAAVPAQADEFMDKVKAEVVMFAGPQSDWRGPTAAPKPEAGKHVAYLSSNQQNDASREWGTHIQNVGEKIGWKVTSSTGAAARSAGRKG